MTVQLHPNPAFNFLEADVLDVTPGSPPTVKIDWAGWEFDGADGHWTTISGVTGTTGINGSREITNFTDNGDGSASFDLVGATGSGSYTGGGSAVAYRGYDYGFVHFVSLAYGHRAHTGFPDVASPVENTGDSQASALLLLFPDTSDFSIHPLADVDLTDFLGTSPAIEVKIRLKAGAFNDAGPGAVRLQLYIYDDGSSLNKVWDKDGAAWVDFGSGGAGKTSWEPSITAAASFQTFTLNITSFALSGFVGTPRLYLELSQPTYLSQQGSPPYNNDATLTNQTVTIDDIEINLPDALEEHDGTSEITVAFTTATTGIIGFTGTTPMTVAFTTASTGVRADRYGTTPMTVAFATATSYEARRPLLGGESEIPVTFTTATDADAEPGNASGQTPLAIAFTTTCCGIRGATGPSGATSLRARFTTQTIGAVS